MPVSVNFTIVDGKGAKSTTSFNLPDGLLSASYSEIALGLAQQIKNIITGGIVSAQVCFAVDISSITDVALADPLSDVEEGATFVWNSVGGFHSSNRIATFDEQFILTGTRQVDVLDATIIDFIGAIEEGITTTGEGTPDFTDYRGADITGYYSARESFQRSRR